MSRSDFDRLCGLVPTDGKQRPHALLECDGMKRTRLRLDGLRTRTELGTKKTIFLDYPPDSWGYIRHHIMSAQNGLALRYVGESQQSGRWEYFTIPLEHILQRNSCTTIQPEDPLLYDLVYHFTTAFKICPFCCFPVHLPSQFTPRNDSSGGISDSTDGCLRQNDMTDCLVITVPTAHGDAVTVTPLAPKVAKRSRLPTKRVHHQDQVYSTAVYQPPPVLVEYQVEIYCAKMFYRQRPNEPYTMVQMPLEIPASASNTARVSRHARRRSTQFLSQCGNIPKHWRSLTPSHIGTHSG